MFSIPESIADPSAEAAVSLLEAAAEQVSKLNTIPLSNRDRLTMLRRLEAVTRALPAVGLELVAQLHEQWDTGEFASSSMIDVLADSLRITPAEARARWRAADDLAHHTSLTGEVLDPVLPAIATAQADGVIGAAHVKIVRDTLAHLPCVVDAETKAHAEAELAHYATQLRPDQLRKVADKLEALINPDGVFTDVDRARRRSFTLGRQGPDLMSRCTLIADPELRAYLETVLAKYAKPGICNPDDDKPCVEDEPDPDTSQRDTRSAPQRQHDGLKTVLRDSIASGRLGQHRGLPVTRIVSMTLRELETALGTTQSTHPASSAPLDRGCPARPKYAAKMVAAMDVASSAEASVSRGAVGAAYSAEPVGAVNVAYPVDVASSAEASVSRGAVGAAYSAEPVDAVNVACPVDVVGSAGMAVSRDAVYAAYSAEPVDAVNAACPVDVANSAGMAVSRDAVYAAYSAEPVDAVNAACPVDVANSADVIVPEAVADSGGVADSGDVANSVDAVGFADRSEAVVVSGGVVTPGEAVDSVDAVGFADRSEDAIVPGGVANSTDAVIPVDPVGVARSSGRAGPMGSLVDISDVTGPPVATGGGALLSLGDALRLAAHAHHYLALFDDRDGRPLYLARTKRIATADQRIVLHARDIGCSFPGCAKPGYLCQTHHRNEWADGGHTDVDQLTFACEPHHRLVGRADTNWTTTATPPGHPCAGRTRWTPPTHIDPSRRPRINHYHHPHEYLTPAQRSERTRSG